VAVAALCQSGLVGLLMEGLKPKLL